MTTAYHDFIASKRIASIPTGFDVDRRELNPMLFPWQGDCVHWALRRGRCAFYWDCGLGKSGSQLEWAAKVWRHTGKPVLILAPILVGWQTLEEADKFNIQAPRAVVADQQDVIACGGICISNYEKLHKFDASCFAGIVLDESQILRSFMGKTKQALCEAFRQTPYKLCCSATPAPNDLLELGNQADFLGIMPSREMIARWFINDTMHAGNYRLMKHAVQDFWRWVSSWAVCLGSPADLGHSDEGFVLPPFNVHEHIVRGTSWLVSEKEDGVSATSIHGEKRKTLHDRCEAVAALVNDSPDQWAIWCGTDYEADELIRQCCRGEKDWKKSGVAEIRGPNSDFWKETILKAFKHGDLAKLIIKPKIASLGQNWQHCHKTTWFASYSFADYYQAMRRLYRFGQLSPVDAHLIASENELNLLDAVKRKSESHEFMKCEVAACVKEFQQAEIYGRKLQEYVPTERMRLPEWLKSKV